jgi:hypothetical protein
MHEGPTTAPRKSVHLVTQLQHLGNLLCVELSRKLENLLPGLLHKDIPREIAELGQIILPTPTHEEDLQMHYCQAVRMGADCIKQCSIKMLPKAKAIGTCTTCVSTIDEE